MDALEAAKEEAQEKAAVEGKACSRGCGFMATWHPTHCCAKCARNGEHGSKCQRMPVPGVRKEADEMLKVDKKAAKEAEKRAKDEAKEADKQGKEEAKEADIAAKEAEKRAKKEAKMAKELDKQAERKAKEEAKAAKEAEKRFKEEAKAAAKAAKEAEKKAKEAAKAAKEAEKKVKAAQKSTEEAQAAEVGFDFSFPVVVEDGRKLKIQWRIGDDPLQVAACFAEKHGIPQDELQTIQAFMRHQEAVAAPRSLDSAPAENAADGGAPEARALECAGGEAAGVGPPEEAAERAEAAAAEKAAAEDAGVAQLQAMGFGPEDLLRAVLRDC